MHNPLNQSEVKLNIHEFNVYGFYYLLSPLFIYLSIYSFIRSFIHSFIHTCIHIRLLQVDRTQLNFTQEKHKYDPEV